VTIRLVVGHYLWVVHCDHASILHCYGDMKPQMLDGRTHAQVILYSVQCYCISLEGQKCVVDNNTLPCPLIYPMMYCQSRSVKALMIQFFCSRLSVSHMLPLLSYCYFVLCTFCRRVVSICS